MKIRRTEFLFGVLFITGICFNSIPYTPLAIFGFIFICIALLIQFVMMGRKNKMAILNNDKVIINRFKKGYKFAKLGAFLIVLSSIFIIIIELDSKNDPEKMGNKLTLAPMENVQCPKCNFVFKISANAIG